MHQTFVILHNSPTGLCIEEDPGHNRESANQRAKQLAAKGGQALVMQVVGAVHDAPFTDDSEPKGRTDVARSATL